MANLGHFSYDRVKDGETTFWNCFQWSLRNRANAQPQKEDNRYVTWECLLDVQVEEAGEASVMIHSCNPSTQEAEARLLLSLRSAWDTQ